MYTSTMERVARGFVVGVAVGGTTFLLLKANHMVLNALSDVNVEVVKVLLRLVQPPRENNIVDLKHSCKDDDCVIVSCFCDRDHYSCYDCTKQELKP